MDRLTPTIVFEDAAILAVNKPPGWTTTGSEATLPDLVSWARAHLHREGRAGPFVGCVHRLDVPVAGLVLLAKTPAAARALAAQMRDHRIDKHYEAIVSGRVTPPQGTLRHGLRQGGIHSKVRCVRIDTPGSRAARLDYRVRAHYTRASHLAIQLHTGRRHQIRTQLAAFGHPIWGDYKYGSRLDLPSGIALLAQSLVLTHPLTGRRLTLRVTEPPTWPPDIEARSRSDATWLGRPSSGLSPNPTP